MAPGAKLALRLGLRYFVVLALHRTEASDGQRAQRVLRTARRAGPTGDLRPEADGELVDANAITASQHEVAQLVKDDEHREHYEERNDFLDTD